MNWFDTSGLTNLAKNALKEAQKTIDKALDIQDESGDDQDVEPSCQSDETASPSTSSSSQKESSDFLSSWGLTVSAESGQEQTDSQQTVVTESPSKSAQQTLWGSFAGSFFEPPQKEGSDSTIVLPPKAKSMNVISDSSYGSQDDLFTKSQLVMSDTEAIDSKTKDTVCKDFRRSSSQSNRLSLVSSHNSSDSVEVLSQSIKSTPDSEPPSVNSISHSSSINQRLNSESVEILPDSLISPSSIECLGFDSYVSDKNSSTSSNVTTESDNKSTPVGDKTEKPETADSVSLVADDDDDTISYNSVSECTAPTVLDTDENAINLPSKPLRSDPVKRDLLSLEPSILPQRMQISENSSNDGSWSDRTLNADNDSMIIDTTVEEQKKDIDQEDILIDKLSDSSSFYNVNVSGDLLKSESSAFVNVEKHQCQGSIERDANFKERTSPTSSDGKSDLVKIGSDRTSGHTSGDEIETATSSDIEIIPSPNGDGHSFSRNSPAKYAFKQSKFDGTTSPNLVDLVLGKSLASKIRGHNRELSEASIQSNNSDDSQGSENERLMRRLSEMAEILEARENRLMEVSRSNAELAESNADLKKQMECLLSKHEVGDINTITEDYTQRMSALEKKFQQAIREKDQLRKHLDSMKTESSSRKNSSELENSLKERDDMITQLQEEGEKLARQQLQHSNIIKKLRAKEKDNEQVIKSLRDKIAEQTAELDRVKRSLSAKEQLEVSQIEAVYRLTTANKKLEAELVETKSALDDTTQRFESIKTSLDAARRELTELQRSSAELQRRKGDQAALEREKLSFETECEILKAQVKQLRTEMVNEEKRWISREEALRRELHEARDLCSTLEARGANSSESGHAALLSQLASLQRSALDRERSHAVTLRSLQEQIAELELSLAKANERERLSRDETQSLLDRVATSEELLQEAQSRLETATLQCHNQQGDIKVLQEQLTSKTREVESLKAEHQNEMRSVRAQLAEVEEQLASDRAALDTEKKRSAILQEQVSCRGDVSPPHSVISDSLSSSLWLPDESGMTTPPVAGGGSALGVETALCTLQRRDGELRALTARCDQLLAERRAAHAHVASLQAKLDEYQSLQEQYDALLQMYGEKEEQLEEVKLDLQDVTQLYKAQLDELIALKRRVAAL